MLRTTLAFLLLAGVASAQDSPLVALAKRTHRTASKTPVITNESLATLKGRVSFAAGQTQSAPAPAYVPASSAPGPQARTTSAAPAVPVDYSLPSSARNIEPQVSARTTMPESSAHTIEPTSGARTIEPQSTARTIEPQVVVRNPQ